MNAQDDKRKSTRTLGMVLAGIGAVLILAGLAFLILIVLAPTSAEPASAGSAARESTIYGGLFCCAPFALPGAILGVVGGILWWNNKEEPWGNP